MVTGDAACAHQKVKSSADGRTEAISELLLQDMSLVGLLASPSVIRTGIAYTFTYLHVCMYMYSKKGRAEGVPYSSHCAPCSCTCMYICKI